MSVMSTPDVWSGQERLLTVDDVEDMPADEFLRDDRAALGRRFVRG